MSTARPRKPRFQAEVRRIRRVSPKMLSITFGGEELAGFVWSGPAAHIKLIADTWVRTYTPRRFDAQALELDVEFVIHGEGPASGWAEQASVGQRLVIAGPGRSYAIDPEAEWHVLAGDDSALPALATILEVLPPHSRAQVLIEVSGKSEARELESRAASVQIDWLVREPEPRNAGRALEAAVRALELPSGAGQIYVACEADAMRRIRRLLLNERAVPRNQLVTRGYWRLGETDHPDRDYGEDVG
ncbi:MAG TPA: siderophore-interacting protein [Steroidobacteraceae bacterium]|nr:siderophore-interacting protein [Steroidobacteraceae bacterium]